MENEQSFENDANGRRRWWRSTLMARIEFIPIYIIKRIFWWNHDVDAEIKRDAKTIVLMQKNRTNQIQKKRFKTNWNSFNILCTANVQSTSTLSKGIGILKLYLLFSFLKYTCIVYCALTGYRQVYSIHIVEYNKCITFDFKRVESTCCANVWCNFQQLVSWCCIHPTHYLICSFCFCFCQRIHFAKI